MKDETTLLPAVDPNPTEVAECSLTISAHDWQTIDGDKIAFEMVELYDRQARYSLVCRVFDELEKTNSALVYVGSREKCEKWAEIFNKHGLMTETETF